MQEYRQEKSLIKQNILLYLQKIGITPYECYKRTGITRGILTQKNGISEENIAKFLAYYTDINVEWLITGQGNMFKDKPNDSPLNLNDIHGSDKIEKLKIEIEKLTSEINELRIKNNELNEKLITAQETIIKIMSEKFNTEGLTTSKDKPKHPRVKGFRNINDPHFRMVLDSLALKRHSR
jgi:regulator of replication initiation timing